MTAGSLNRRIIIQKPSTEQDEFGQPTETWKTVLECWASITAASGKEVYATSGFVSQLSHVVVIRFPAVAIHSDMRVLYRGRTFSVQAVSDDDEGRVWLKLLCLELNQ